MASPSSKCATPAGPVSTGPSLTKQIETLRLTRDAFRTLVIDRLDELTHTSDALLYAAAAYQSQGNAQAAHTELARARTELDSVIGPPRVRDLNRRK